jgi:hypothetical protein
VTYPATQRLLLLALLLFLGPIVSASTVTLLPQEQAIANYMTTNPGQGRPYMVLDPIIEAVARARAKDMAVRNYFSHVNPDGVAANYLLAQAGYQLPAGWTIPATNNYVESIAAGYASAADTWSAWMASAPHEEHLLAQNAFFATETHYGVGYYQDPNSTYDYYWVVITAPPQPIAVTSPTPGSQVTSSTIPVAGTTDPAAAVATVQFRIENTTGTSDWQPATGTVTWSGTATGLAPGANLLHAQSLDSSGNLLADGTASFTYVVQASLTVTTSGSGSVTAGYSGVTTRDVGQSITIKATAARGSIFTGWTGSVVSGSPSLTFTMQEGMNLQANFEPNPFPPVSGAYYGILTTGSGAQDGLVRLALSSGGIFSGRLNLSGTALSLSGALDPAGSATVTIAQRDGSPWIITLQADLTGGSGQITGSVTDGGQTYGFTVSQATFTPGADPAPQAGHYTVVLPPDPTMTGTSTPQGSGFATIFVNAYGTAAINGRLADGTAFSATDHVANDGTLALYSAPGGAAHGSILNGLLTFRSTDAGDLDGSLAWTRAANAKDPYYPAGFAVQLPAVGSHFVRPTAVEPETLTSGTATAALGGGNLSQTLSLPVVIHRAETATMLNPGQPDLTLHINSISGAVTGKFLMPDGTTTSPVGGVVLQKQSAAFGYFRGITQCGSFSLTPGS